MSQLKGPTAKPAVRVPHRALPSAAEPAPAPPPKAESGPVDAYAKARASTRSGLNLAPVGTALTLPNAERALARDLDTTGQANLRDKLSYNETVPQGGATNPPLDIEREEPMLSVVHQHFDEQLQQAFPGGVTWVPPLANPKSPEAADLKNAVAWSLSPQRGCHQDRVVNLNGKQVLISANTDANGALKVTVHGPGKPSIPAASTFGTSAKAIAALEKDFGMSVSKSPPFTAEELSKAHAAFSLFNGSEREALRGIVLTRVKTLEGASALYEPKTLTSPPRLVRTISVSDAVFAGDRNTFVGSGKAGSAFPLSIEILAHEAAHAIETTPYLKANLATEVVADQIRARWPATKRAVEELERTSPPNTELLRTVSQVTEALDRLARSTSPSEQSVAKQALDLATGARDKAIAALPTEIGKKTAGAVAHNQNAMARLGLDFSSAQQAQNAEGKGALTRREAQFEAFVKENDLPAITNYAHRSGDREFFAEALALFKTDPEWMKGNSPRLHAWFEAGHHL